MTSHTRFNDALLIAVEFVQTNRQALPGAVIVRDLLGRPRIVATVANLEALDPALDRLHERLAAFSPGRNSLIVDPELLREMSPASASGSREVSGVPVIERQITGANWNRTRLPDKPPQVPRFTFFGLKGGVGRSTALSLLARELAATDRKVLAIDLDLESPGLSSLMLAPDALPDYGVVDWLVESAVGQGDDDLLRGMVATSGLAAGTGGSIRVVPAGGTSGGYLEKLSRTTLGLGVDDDRNSFAALLAKMVDGLEAVERPDVVLIDSRAGLHDLAAVAVTRLGGTTFLFAVDTAQTWAGYRLLFDAWRSRPSVARDVREMLQIVAAQVPETERTAYLTRMTERAWDLFGETLYDESDSKEESDEDSFNFDLNAIDAPHLPVPIYWGREFQGYDPVRAPNELTKEQIRAGYGVWLDYVFETLEDEVS